MADDTIADRVRVAMRAVGMNQTELAKVTELTPDKLSKCLHGKRQFSSLELALIAEATATTVYELLGLQTRTIQNITICPTRSWACQFGECPNEPHGWADDEDIEHARATGQDWETIAEQSCGCTCVKGHRNG